jgi:hypothetical protein
VPGGNLQGYIDPGTVQLEKRSGWFELNQGEGSFADFKK